MLFRMKIVVRIRVARVSSHAALLVDPLVIQRGIACERSTSAHSRVRRTRLPPSPRDGTFHCARCPCKSGRRNNTRQHSVMGHFPKHLPAVLPGTAGMASQARISVHAACQTVRRPRSRTHLLYIREPCKEGGNRIARQGLFQRPRPGQTQRRGDGAAQLCTNCHATIPLGGRCPRSRGCTDSRNTFVNTRHIRKLCRQTNGY